MIAQPMIYARENSQVVYVSDLTRCTIERAKPFLRAMGMNHRFVFVVTTEEDEGKYLDFRALAVEIHEAGGQVVMAETTSRLRESLCCDLTGRTIQHFTSVDEAVKAKVVA